MSLRYPSIPTLVAPKLLDAAVSAINTTLLAELTWLDNAYGNVERRQKEVNGRRIFYPGVYSGDSDYYNLMPDGHLGNYSFFYIEDGIDVMEAKGRAYYFSVRYALVFWFDYRTVYSADWEQRSINNVQNEVFAAIKKFSLANAQIMADRAFLDAQNIYRLFTVDEVEQQYLMRPYGGLRVEGIIKYNDQIRC